MYNLYTKFARILEICKKYSENLVNESENKKQEIWQSFFAKVDNNRATKCTLVLFIPQLRSFGACSGFLTDTCSPGHGADWWYKVTYYMC